MKKIILGIVLLSSSVSATDVDAQLERLAERAAPGTVESWVLVLCPSLKARRAAQRQEAHYERVEGLLIDCEQAAGPSVIRDVAKCLAAMALIDLTDLPECIAMVDEAARKPSEACHDTMDGLKGLLDAYTIATEKVVLRELVDVLRRKASVSSDVDMQKRVNALVRALNERLFELAKEN